MWPKWVKFELNQKQKKKRRRKEERKVHRFLNFLDFFLGKLWGFIQREEEEDEGRILHFFDIEQMEAKF